MGIVYRAEDTKLDRSVALKLLPASALTSEDDRARFYREARAAAALSHPNIAHIYEIDEAEAGGESRPFIAMEYIDGETLSDRIAKGPLPIHGAISIASQIAEGLKAAHKKEIVHRDIKSGNVMLTNSGVVKILDFGLAKTAASTKLTQMGSTLGTVAYMSPEQARGEEVDGRTDLWSLGAVLYEMVSGRMPFAGDYEQAIVYGILNEEPQPLTALRTGVPIALERVVAKLLAKDPRHRYQHADEIPVDLSAVDSAESGLRSVSEPATLASAPPAHSAGRKRIPTGLLIAAAAVFVALSGSAGWFLRGTPPEPRTTNMVVPAPITGLRLHSAAISPDGSMLAAAYVGGSLDRFDVESVGENAGVYLRRLDDFEFRFLKGSENGLVPEFSPDGSRLVFISGGRLRIVGTDGGPVETLYSAETLGALSWWADDSIVFNEGFGFPLSRGPAGTGVPERITELDLEEAERSHSGPAVLLPNREHMLYTVQSGVSFESDHVIAVRIDGSDKRVVTRGHLMAIGEPGILLYLVDNVLMAARFDVSTGSLTGAPRAAADGVRWARLSQRGDLMYITGPGIPNRRLTWVSRDGTTAPVSNDTRPYFSPSVSPDGNSVAVTVYQDGLLRIWTYDANSGQSTRITGDNSAAFPTWSLDGSRLYYTSSAQGTIDLYVRSADGSDEPVLVSTTGKPLLAGPLTPDGSQMIVTEVDPERQGDLLLVDLSDGNSRPLLVDQHDVWAPALSPNGKWLTYSTDEAGKEAIHVRSFPDMRLRLRIDAQNPSGPVWSVDGRSIFYTTSRGLWEARLTGTTTLSVASSTLLFEGKYTGSLEGLHEFAVSSGGDKFLMIEADPDEAREGELRVIVNWTSDFLKLLDG